MMTTVISMTMMIKMVYKQTAVIYINIQPYVFGLFQYNIEATTI